MLRYFSTAGRPCRVCDWMARGVKTLLSRLRMWRWSGGSMKMIDLHARGRRLAASDRWSDRTPYFGRVSDSKSLNAAARRPRAASAHRSPAPRCSRPAPRRASGGRSRTACRKTPATPGEHELRLGHCRLLAVRTCRDRYEGLLACNPIGNGVFRKENETFKKCVSSPKRPVDHVRPAHRGRHPARRPFRGPRRRPCR